MTKTYKALSLLLTYPEREVQGAAAEIGAALDAEGLLPARARRGLASLMTELATRDLYDLQERYVLLFDRTRSLSLHLFEHAHGESRERGAAMVDLAELYGRHGFEVGAAELPDYLPLFLEFLSLLDAAEARELLGQPLHIIAAVGERLRRRGSPYATVFEALEALAGTPVAAEPLAELLSAPEDDPGDLEAIDRVWEEAAVTFGPEGNEAAGGECPAAADMVRRMQPGAPVRTN